MALGHEVAGEVCAMGEAAEGVAVGGRYVLYPWVGCGQCALCAADEEHLCGAPRHHGVNVDGGFSNFVLVPHPRYLLPMGDLDPAHAATLACSGLTAYSALRKAGPAAAGRPLLIIGAGGVGSAALAVARALGDAPIVADIDPAKRAAALRAGAAEAIDPNDPQARRTLLKQYGGMAAAIDFVGATASADFGLASLRKGGRLVVVGLFGGALELALPLLPMRTVAIEGSYVGSLQEMRELMALAHAGKHGRHAVAAHGAAEGAGGAGRPARRAHRRAGRGGTAAVCLSGLRSGCAAEQRLRTWSRRCPPAAPRR
jgi:alcohol dehydrogenase/propanol-preferring alcohol dehydrogenase